MYPSDYLRDTRALSLAAKGGWFDVLCMLHSSSIRGTMSLPLVGWARIMSASVDQADAVISELDGMKIADVTRHSNGDVTLSSRRMLREHITREQTRLRVARHRARDPCNASETPQKTETRNQTPHSPPVGGGNASLPSKPSPNRFRRGQKLETLNDERERIEYEMREILRPGGCAYNVQPVGEKAERLEKLKEAHASVVAAIAKRRGELASA